MEELIARITGNVGLEESTARKAVGVILSFLYQEGDRDKVVALAERIPGAAEFIDTSHDDSAATLGGLGGMRGGGAMAVLGNLQSLGLGMGEIQGVTQETVNFARERGGSDLVNDIVASIPGLSQFV
ncbi:MAG TPA: DUF2267 domain-containing protein [Propylenella sp.]|nr:DUF2267 domain-containing protein [Propylenella sp.]